MATNVIEENERLGALLKYEADKNFSRDVVTIAKGQNLKMGTVLGKVSADGTYKIVSIAEDETDGSDTSAGILLEDIDATNATKKALMLARIGMVDESKVIYPTSATDDQKAAILEELKKLGIITRTGA